MTDQMRIKLKEFLTSAPYDLEYVNSSDDEELIRMFMQYYEFAMELLPIFEAAESETLKASRNYQYCKLIVDLHSDLIEDELLGVPEKHRSNS